MFLEGGPEQDPGSVTTRGLQQPQLSPAWHRITVLKQWCSPLGAAKSLQAPSWRVEMEEGGGCCTSAVN